MICIYAANQTGLHGNGLCIIHPSFLIAGGNFSLMLAVIFFKRIEKASKSLSPQLTLMRIINRIILYLNMLTIALPLSVAWLSPSVYLLRGG